MATLITAFGAELLLFLAKKVSSAPKGMAPVDAEDAARVFDAWAEDPANAAKVTSERARLLKDGPLSVALNPKLKGIPETVAVDRAALRAAIASGVVVAVSKAAVDLPPRELPDDPVPPRFWAALIVRDVTGTPLKNLRVVGFWQDGVSALEGSPEETTTGASGVAIWTGVAKDPLADGALLDIRILLPEGWVTCEATSAGWQECPYEAIAVWASSAAPAIQTVWVRSAPLLEKRFAWQNETLRHTFYPFRNLMLRSFLQADYEAATAERFTFTSKEFDAFRADAQKDVDAFNKALAEEKIDEALALKGRLRDLIAKVPSPTKSTAPEQYRLLPNIDAALAARVKARQWMLGPKGPRRLGHRALMDMTLDALKGESSGVPRYPMWARYLVIHFSGMLYTSAHGSLGRPDTLVRFLRLGTPTVLTTTEKVQRERAGSNEPGFEIDHELSAASPSALVALALEAVGESAWYPERAQGQAPTPSSTTQLVTRLRLLLTATGSGLVPRLLVFQGSAQPVHKLLSELCAAGAVQTPSALSTPVRALLRDRVSDLWQSTRSIDTWTRTLTGFFIEASDQNDWLAQLLHRRPVASGAGATGASLFSPFPDEEIWRAMAAYTPLRATHAPDIVAKSYDKDNHWTIVFPEIATSGQPEASAVKSLWKFFLYRWRGALDTGRISSSDASAVDWRAYHQRTLEPIIRGVCNENNEMSYQARGLMLSAGGGLRSNANMFFAIRDKGGAFGPYAPPVEVGDSVFFVADVRYPPAAREEWNVIDPAQKFLLDPGRRGATEKFLFTPPRQVDIVHCFGTLDAKIPEAKVGAPPTSAETVGELSPATQTATLVAGGFVPKWGHEVVVVRIDERLGRIFVHDTALPTGVHLRGEGQLSGGYLGKFGTYQEAPELQRERARREALMKARFVTDDLTKFSTSCDDGEDPDPKLEPIKSYVAEKYTFIQPILAIYGRLP